jgi:hypothetical protein
MNRNQQLIADGIKNLDKGLKPVLLQRGMGKKMMHYFLNEDHTVRECSLMEWGKQIQEMSINHTKHVAEDMINGNHISTVWLGLDHNYYGGPPLLFETMVFGQDGNDVYMDRYYTWDEAIEGHKKAVQWVLKEYKDDE